MAGDSWTHIPVMAVPALSWLAIRPEGTYVDCTAGAGGHSSLIAEQLDTGRLIALDRDVSAVARASKRLAAFPCAQVHCANYGQLDTVLQELGVSEVDGVLIDAGCSSMQLDDPERGFSFQETGPLDMRMDTSNGVSAREYLRGLSVEEVADLLRRYGDVGPAGRIAKAMVRRSADHRLESTEDLVAAVCEGLNFVRETPDEVRTVFQAVRIAVNEELRWLERGVESAISVLKPGGRLVVIAFHSGEDRVVKSVLRAASRPQRELYPDGRVKSVVKPVLKLLTKKPVLPDAAEVVANSRAKSAKLRAAERLAG